MGFQWRRVAWGLGRTRKKWAQAEGQAVESEAIRDWGPMASAGAGAYNGRLGLCPQRGPGAEPLVGRSGRQPPEAESLLAFGRPTKATKFAELTVSGKTYLLHLMALHFV